MFLSMIIVKPPQRQLEQTGCHTGQHKELATTVGTFYHTDLGISKYTNENHDK